MPTRVTRSGASGSVRLFNSAGSTLVSARDTAVSHDTLTTKYIYVDETYKEFLEEDLLYGLNIIVVNSGGNTSILIPDTLSYKMQIQIINEMPDYTVSVYSGY